MEKKILFFAMLAVVMLAVSGCGAKKPADNVELAPPASNKPSINSFSISQEPVPAKNPTPVKAPAPAANPATSSTPAVDAVQTVQVEIKGFAFNPAELTVAVGSTVVWTNGDAISHDIKSASFNSPLLSTGQTFQQKFTTAGTYDYSCGIHPSMSGKITVK